MDATIGSREGDTNVKRERLNRDGYCVFESVLDAQMLNRARQASNRLLEAQEEAHFKAQRSTGSLISVYDDAFFAELVTYPGALILFDELGFDDPKWASGYVISKPPKSPPLFWHQDWWGWDEPSSYEPPAQQLFFMYYLVDTESRNGCLKLIPGSHLKRHAAHDTAPEAHTDDARRMADPDHPGYKPMPGEVDVPVRAGDLVVGDARLLHASHGNASEVRRTVITLWYYPAFSSLPEGIRSDIASRNQAGTWPDRARALIQPLIPAYEGNRKPTRWNRIPGEALQSLAMVSVWHWF